MAATKKHHRLDGGKTYSLEQFGLIDGVQHFFSHSGAGAGVATIDRNRYTNFNENGALSPLLLVAPDERVGVTRFPDECLVARPGGGSGVDETARALAQADTLESGEIVAPNTTLWALGKHWDSGTAGATAPTPLTEANILAAGFVEEFAATGRGGNKFAADATQLNTVFLGGVTAGQEVKMANGSSYVIKQDYTGTFAAAVEGTDYEFIAAAAGQPPAYADNKAAFPLVTSGVERVFHNFNGLTYVKNAARTAWEPESLRAELAYLPTAGDGAEPETNQIVFIVSGIDSQTTWVYQGDGVDAGPSDYYEQVTGVVAETGPLQYARVTVDTALSPYTHTLTNTDGGVVNHTLPSPLDGMWVVLSQLGVDALNVDSNGGELIDGGVGSVALTGGGATLTFRYDLASNNWEVFGSILL